MRKQVINEMLPYAQDVLKENFKSGEIPKEFRGYIATFGAAVTMGSLLAAIAFNSNEDARTKEKRHRLIPMILDVLKKYHSEIKEDNLFDYVKNHKESNEVKENILHAAIALKLALNLFELTK